MSERQANVILAFVFGVIFVTALLMFVLFVPSPAPSQFEVIRIVLALAASGVAATLPGILKLQLGEGTNLTLRAGGALAVFVIVYFYSPAHWTSNIIQITKGPNSAAIVGNHNFVVGPGSAADKPRWEISPPAAETRQTTIGPGSPAIVGDHNNNNDIDARALKRLNDQRDEKNLAIAQKIAEADEWARKYRELDQQLTEARSQAVAKGDEATLIKAVQDLLHKGKLEEAGNIYDQLLARDESNVDRAAQNHFGRAQTLQFRPLDALPHYAMAYQYRPDHVEYALGYARILGHQKQFSKAEAVFEGLLPQMRDLAAQNPAAYRPGLATTLSNLAKLYRETRQLTKVKAVEYEISKLGE